MNPQIFCVTLNNSSHALVTALHPMYTRNIDLLDFLTLLPCTLPITDCTVYWILSNKLSFECSWILSQPEYFVYLSIINLLVHLGWFPNTCAAYWSIHHQILLLGPTLMLSDMTYTWCTCFEWSSSWLPATLAFPFCLHQRGLAACHVQISFPISSLYCMTLCECMY